LSGKGLFLFRAQARKEEDDDLLELDPSEGEYLLLEDERAEAWLLKHVAQ
jgi:hypothetical protein